MKKLFYWITCYAYGGVMLGAALALFLSNEIGAKLLLVNILGCLPYFFLLFKKKIEGVYLLLILAAVNGYVMNGSLNILHFGIRVIFSIFLLYVYRCDRKRDRAES